MTPEAFMEFVKAFGLPLALLIVAVVYLVRKLDQSVPKSQYDKLESDIESLTEKLIENTRMISELIKVVEVQRAEVNTALKGLTDLTKTLAGIREQGGDRK